MIKLKTILAEALSDIVWHFTQLSSAKEILQQNKFELSIVTGADLSPLGGTKQYFLSTARQKWGGYGKFIPCRIELDGRKLSQRYKGGAIDYWQLGSKASEYEDRLFSNEPIIPNAKNYIKRIDLVIDDDFFTVKQNQLVDVMELCLQKSIPCFLFRDKKKYDSGIGGERVTKELVESLRDSIDNNDTPYVTLPPNAGYMSRLIYIANVIGIPLDEINKMFLTNEKAKRDYDAKMAQSGDYVRQRYGSYEDFIQSGWAEYKKHLAGIRELIGGDYSGQGASAVNAEIQNFKKQMGSVARELVVRIFKEGRRNKITPDKMLDFILKRAKEDFENTK